MLTEFLKRAVIDLMEVEFSDLDITVESGSECFVTIYPKWLDFGPVEIHEDHGQLIVNWGRFTHCHIDSYEESHGAHIREIVDQLRYQVSNVVADKVAFWGGCRGGSGGFFSLDRVESLDGRLPAYLWSGKEIM